MKGTRRARPQVRLRDYVPGDRSLIDQCLNASRDQMAALDPWRRRVPGRNLHSEYLAMALREIRLHSGFLLVAEADGEPAGIAIAWQIPVPSLGRGSERPTLPGFLSELAVLPRWRGKGIGTRLVQETERRFRRAGCDQLQLFVFAPNTRAKRLYARLGFSTRHTQLAKQLAPPRARWPADAPRGRRTSRRRRTHLPRGKLAVHPGGGGTSPRRSSRSRSRRASHPT